jgi:hypothetical protein
LFGYCYGGAISNLSVAQSYVEGGSYVGAIAGYTMNTMLNACSNGGTVRGSMCVGGVAGFSGGEVGSCINSGSVTGGAGVGGIAGACGGTANLSDCTNSGDIATSDELNPGMLGIIGGVVGTTNANITGCANSGTVTTTGETAGGVVGSANSGTISGCHSTGVLTGADNVGGIAGRVISAGGISECYSTTDISGSNYIGGIAGLLSVAVLFPTATPRAT